MANTLTPQNGQLEHLFQVSPGVFYELSGPSGEAMHPRFISSSVHDLFGVSPEEAVEPGFLIKRAMVDLPAMREAALEKAGERGVTSITYPARLGGRTMWLRDTMRCEPQPDGGRVVVGFITDVTHEHLVEAEMRRLNWALAAQARSLAVLLRAGPVSELMRRVCESIVEEPVYILACFGMPEDGPGKPVNFVASAGRGTEYLHGVKISWGADEALGQGPTGIAMRTGTPHIVQDCATDPTYTAWRELGEAYGIRSSVTVPCSHDGRIIGALLVYASEPYAFGRSEMALFQRLSDEIGFAITLDAERRRMEEIEAARRQAEENLMAAVQLGPGLLYRARLHPTHAEILDVFGDTARVTHDITDDDDGRAALAAIFNAQDRLAAMWRLDDQQAHTSDYAVVTPQGDTRWLRNTVRRTAIHGGALDLVGYIAEVTQEKEQALHRQQVTTLLTLGEMAAGMAHELTQPLSSIVLAAENASFKLQRNPPALGEANGKLERIIGEAHRASRLIEHMRVFARNEPESRQPIAWSDALASALEILEGKIRGTRVISDIPADLPPVMGWSIPLEQVLINLISNSVDAYQSCAEEVERVVRLEARVSGSQVVMLVADRAGGIPAHMLPRVFEPFLTTKPVGKGTGLGLAIVADAVQAMEGSITATNQDGGAVFEIRLPMA